MLWYKSFYAQWSEDLSLRKVILEQKNKTLHYKSHIKFSGFQCCILRFFECYIGFPCQIQAYSMWNISLLYATGTFFSFSFKSGSISAISILWIARNQDKFIRTNPNNRACPISHEFQLPAVRMSNVFRKASLRQVISHQLWLKKCLWSEALSRGAGSFIFQHFLLMTL